LYAFWLLRNGVGNPVSLSPGDPGYKEGTTQTQGTLLSGWSAMQTQLPDDPHDLPDDTNNNSLAKFADFTQSSAATRLSTIANCTSSTPARAGPYASGYPAAFSGGSHIRTRNRCWSILSVSPAFLFVSFLVLLTFHPSFTHMSQDL
jgi:hypothetical protein